MKVEVEPRKVTQIGFESLIEKIHDKKTATKENHITINK